MGDKDVNAKIVEEVVFVNIVDNDVLAKIVKNGFCEHDKIRATCKDCGGSAICEHDKRRATCKDCRGSAICEHDKRRATCKDCGGSAIFEHDKRRATCKDCGGSAICEHGMQRRQCEDCGEEDAEKETKAKFKRLPELQIEYVIRVVPNYSPSIAILIGNYFFNSK